MIMHTFSEPSGNRYLNWMAPKPTDTGELMGKSSNLNGQFLCKSTNLATQTELGTTRKWHHLLRNQEYKQMVSSDTFSDFIALLK